MLSVQVLTACTIEQLNTLRGDRRDQTKQRMTTHYGTNQPLLFYVQSVGGFLFHNQRNTKQ